MASPVESDLLSRALGFDLGARKEIFRNYVYGSARVRRMAPASGDVDSFLHDCFVNVLRTGRSWNVEHQGSLSEWVESVAAWTALVSARRSDQQARAAHGEIRMCAETEGEDATQGKVLPAYAPPLIGKDDSPSSRVLAFLDDTEKVVFRKRAIENAAWDDTAAAASKPLNTVGSIFVRAASRMARLFGAPVPMEDDLAEVFSRISGRELSTRGRAVSLQLDTAFYSFTSEMRTIGLKTAKEARMIALWGVAHSETPPDDSLRSHLDECSYCADLLRALLLMKQALACQPGVDFLLCPGASTLRNTPDGVREAFDQHLAACPTCREERAGKEAQPSTISGKKTAWALAAILVFCLVSVAGYFAYRRNVAHRSQDAVASLTAEKSQNTVVIDRRYADLTQNVHMDAAGIMAYVLPANQPLMKYALDQYGLGNIATALTVSAQLAEKTNDAGAMVLYSSCLRREGLISDSYNEMLKAEAVAPRSPMRCWITLQYALLVGDRPVIDREVQHLTADPKYKGPANKILASVQARK